MFQQMLFKDHGIYLKDKDSVEQDLRKQLKGRLGMCVFFKVPFKTREESSKCISIGIMEEQSSQSHTLRESAQNYVRNQIGTDWLNKVVQM